jgi:NADH-quinone oxidoreductase subunit C
MLPEQLNGVAEAAAIEAHDSAAITGGNLDHGEVTLFADAAKIASVCRFLKDRQEYIRLVSVTALDHYPMEPRFEVVYHLHSLANNRRLRIKCALAEGASIDSVTGVWRGANWYEREVFDLFGIVFEGHPNLTRIMMPDDWQGHPLRKDFPTHGHKYSYRHE